METTHITYVKIINTNLQISYLSTVQSLLFRGVSGGTEKHVLWLFMYTGVTLTVCQDKTSPEAMSRTAFSVVLFHGHPAQVCLCNNRIKYIRWNIRLIKHLLYDTKKQITVDEKSKLSQSKMYAYETILVKVTACMVKVEYIKCRQLRRTLWQFWHFNDFVWLQLITD